MRGKRENWAGGAARLCKNVARRMQSFHIGRFAQCSPPRDKYLLINGFREPRDLRGGTAWFLRPVSPACERLPREWTMSLEDSGPSEIASIPLSRRQKRDLVELVAA